MTAFVQSPSAALDIKAEIRSLNAFVKKLKADPKALREYIQKSGFHDRQGKLKPRFR